VTWAGTRYFALQATFPLTTTLLLDRSNGISGLETLLHTNMKSSPRV